MRRGFTLVELLVAVGIIAILMGILLPVAGKVRDKARQTTCRAHLHDIGAQFQMYLNDSHNKLPRVNTMPSIAPPLNDAPSIVEVLERYAGGVKGVYRCPADAIVAESPSSPPGFITYFEREGSSYQWNTFLGALYAGKSISESSLYKAGKQQRLPLMFDYEPFHGRAGELGSTNYLFADMHVGDLLD